MIKAIISATLVGIFIAFAFIVVTMTMKKMETGTEQMFNPNSISHIQR